MSANLSDFQDAIEEAGGEMYEGEYHGRSGFVGYGGTFNSEGHLVALGAQIANSESLQGLLRRPPHIDSMGRGVIAAWPKRFFDDAS